VNSPHRQSRKAKVRRVGRHAAPSAIAKVSERAGKAAPAAAVVGALAVVPLAHGHAQGGHGEVALTGHRGAGSYHHPASAPDRIVLAAAVQRTKGVGGTYTVRAGDTLASIALRLYGKSAYWRDIYQLNSAEIADPNVIYPGEVLKLPGRSVTLTSASSSGGKDGTSSKSSSDSKLSGTLGCSGLEALWESAGGSASEAVTAASIAMAESSGEQFATDDDANGTEDRGYWQINSTHGSLSTDNAYGNARAAVIISADGTNWTPWTTYDTGAYLGQC
jgi:LysM repeat protein